MIRLDFVDGTISEPAGIRSPVFVLSLFYRIWQQWWNPRVSILLSYNIKKNKDIRIENNWRWPQTMAIARHRTSRRTRWLARQSRRYVGATTACTSTWTLEPTTTTRAPFLSLSASPDLIGRFWSALPFFKFYGNNLSHFVDDLGWYWKKCLVLKVSQIECDSTSLPWQGCLQYYMGLEGLFFCPFLSFAKFFDFLFFTHVEFSACVCVTVSVASLIC